MSKILNLQLSYTAQVTPPATRGYLVFDGFQTNELSSLQVLGSGGNTFAYAIPAIVGATFNPVNYSDTAPIPPPASQTYAGTGLKWTNIIVPDNYIIPPSYATLLTDGFAYTNDQHTGVAVKNLAYNVQTEAAGTLSFGAFQVSTAQNGKAGLLGALSAAGADNATVAAIGNIAAVSGAVTKLQSDGLALAALGITDFGSPTGVSFAQYDASVNNFLTGSRDTLNRTVDGLTLSSNPAIDKLAHSIIEGNRLIENLYSGDAVPFSASATLGLEVNFGGVLTISGSVTGTASAEVVIGGSTGDTVVATSNTAIIVGSRNDETIIAGPGNDYINAGGGNDHVVLTNQTGYDYVDGGTGATTVALAGAFSSYTVSRQGNTYLESGAGSLAFGTLTSVAALAFTDGTVSLATHDPLFDPVFYDRTNADVYGNGVAAEAHYDSYGVSEGRNPDALFSTSGYLGANRDVKGAGVNPLDHYDQYGWKEGRDPSASFNTRLYLLQNPDVAAAGIDPLLHYLEYGQFEGRHVAAAIGKVLGPNGFDAEFYLLSNPDVARAGIDPYQHYEQYGWREGRAPNAFFDPGYYLRTNPDVAAAGVDPLLHYDLYGWKEGRNPSASFDTTLYLYHNPDVAAAGIDPMAHYLQYGIFEGRVAYAVPPILAVGTTLSGALSAGHSAAYAITLQGGMRYDFGVSDRGSQNNPSYVPEPVLSLIAANGGVVARGMDISGQSGAGFGFTVPVSGQYVLSVEGSSSADAGRFDLSSLVVTPSNATIVQVSNGGQTLATAYDLGVATPAGGFLVGVSAGSPGGRDDDFKFTLQAGAQVEIDLLLPQRALSVLDAAGHILTTRAAGNGTEQLVAPLGAGTYFIDLARTSASTLPAYAFRLFT